MAYVLKTTPSLKSAGKPNTLKKNIISIPFIADNVQNSQISENKANSTCALFTVHIFVQAKKTFSGAGTAHNYPLEMRE